MGRQGAGRGVARRQEEDVTLRLSRMLDSSWLPLIMMMGMLSPCSLRISTQTWGGRGSHACGEGALARGGEEANLMARHHRHLDVQENQIRQVVPRCQQL